MMRFALLFIFVLLMSFPAYADVYRGFIWGNSMDDIRRYEKAAFFDEHDNSLFFTEGKGRDRILIRYDFRQDRLWRIKTEYLRPHEPRPQLVMDRVIDLQQTFSRTFGKPVSDDLVWKRNAYRRYPELLPEAFSMGDVRIRTIWENKDTRVQLESTRNNMQYEIFYALMDLRIARRQDSGKTFNFNKQP
jgi:hypothetical protein